MTCTCKAPTVKTPTKKKEFVYAQKYGLIILCENEDGQKTLYERLSALGLKAKVVCV